MVNHIATVKSKILFGVDRCMRSFELVAEGKLTPQVQTLDQSARKCVEADTGAAFARRSVGLRLSRA